MARPIHTDRATVRAQEARRVGKPRRPSPHRFLRRQHRRATTHSSFAVRFAWWNFVINGVMAIVWYMPMMIVALVTPLGKQVEFVTFLSVWALGATHAGAALAAYAAVHAADEGEHGRAYA